MLNKAISAVCALALVLVIALPNQASASDWRASDLWAFDFTGYVPEAGIAISRYGNIFGTTTLGGTGPCDAGAGCGTVYELTAPSDGSTTWTFHALYNFQGLADGGFPQAPVTVDRDGVVYGYTAFGSQGTVFRLLPPVQGSTSWRFQRLYVFSGGSDGSLATTYAPLIVHRGRVYGIANLGGGTGCHDFGCGTVFRLEPGAPGVDWSETTLFTFPDRASNGRPNWIVGPDLNGALYVTTGLGDGAVVQFAPPTDDGSPWRETVLTTFAGGSDGREPSNLVLAPNGTLYGIAVIGSFTQVFQLTPPTDVSGWTRTGIATVDVHASGATYGAGSLSPGPNGTLIGIVEGDFDFYPGNVFQLTPPAGGSSAWTYAQLWSFNRGPDRNPLNVEVGQGAHRSDLFGVLNGGDSTNGSLFELSPE
jgi:hypothetical protein